MVDLMGIRNLPKEQLLDLKAYVTENDGEQWSGLAASMVAVDVTHQYLKQRHVELRFDLHTSIGDIKLKIHRHCGTLPEHQTLILRSGGTNVALMDDESKMFGFYSPTSGMEIHVKDSNPASAAAGGWLENTALVERYKMTDEDYDKRSNTVRQFKKDKLAKDPTWKAPTMKSGKEMMQQMGTLPPDLPRGPETIEGIEVGMRCEVQPGARRGVVMFTGEVEGLKGGGNWVGVKFDEPVGKSDGTIKGIRVFECPAGYGAFARGVNVKVGDFPEVDDLADLEDSEEEEEL